MKQRLSWRGNKDGVNGYEWRRIEEKKEAAKGASGGLETDTHPISVRSFDQLAPPVFWALLFSSIVTVFFGSYGGASNVRSNAFSPGAVTS
jgi:hypothetical protein